MKMYAWFNTIKPVKQSNFFLYFF